MEGIDLRRDRRIINADQFNNNYKKLQDLKLSRANHYGIKNRNICQMEYTLTVNFAAKLTFTIHYAQSNNKVIMIFDLFIPQVKSVLKYDSKIFNIKL